MEFKINLGEFFAVPTSVTDEYIKIATADNLKVLLYCLRHAGKSLTVGEISRAVNVSEDSVATAFDFWKQRGLFDNGQLSIDNGQWTIDNKPAPPIIERDYEFTPSEISDIIKDSRDVDYLFKCAEKSYGRPLKPTEQKALAVIVEEYRMSPAVALMLMEYCVSVGKNSPAYIKKTAANWLEHGINSFESAESHIKQLKDYNSVEGELIRLFKIKDIPESKKPLIRKWLYELNLSIEKIYEVYQKTLERTGKLEYTYMDRILSNQDNTPAPTQTTAAARPSYDLEEFYKLEREKYN